MAQTVTFKSVRETFLFNHEASLSMAYLRCGLFAESFTGLGYVTKKKTIVLITFLVAKERHQLKVHFPRSRDEHCHLESWF